VQRDRLYQQTKKHKERETEGLSVTWAPQVSRVKGKKPKEAEDAVSSDNDQIDMRREDAELEKILRDYNNEGRPGDKKFEDILDKPLDLPFYKRIQLPTHLKWVSIYSVSKDTQHLSVEAERERAHGGDPCPRLGSKTAQRGSSNAQGVPPLRRDAK